MQTYTDNTLWKNNTHNVVVTAPPRKDVMTVPGNAFTTFDTFDTFAAFNSYSPVTDTGSADPHNFAYHINLIPQYEALAAAARHSSSWGVAVREWVEGVVGKVDDKKGKGKGKRAVEMPRRARSSTKSSVHSDKSGKSGKSTKSTKSTKSSTSSETFRSRQDLLSDVESTDAQPVSDNFATALVYGTATDESNT